VGGLFEARGRFFVLLPVGFCTSFSAAAVSVHIFVSWLYVKEILRLPFVSLRPDFSFFSSLILPGRRTCVLVSLSDFLPRQERALVFGFEQIPLLPRWILFLAAVLPSVLGSTAWLFSSRFRFSASGARLVPDLFLPPPIFWLCLSVLSACCRQGFSSLVFELPRCRARSAGWFWSCLDLFPVP
jgi:hypothetical protein